MDWGAYLAEVQHDLQVKHLVRIIRSKCENLSPVFRKILIFKLMSPAVDSNVSAFPGCTSSNTPEAVCKYSAVHFFGQNAKCFLYETRRILSKEAPAPFMYEACFHYWLQFSVCTAWMLAGLRAPLIICLWNDPLWKYSALYGAMQRIFRFIVLRLAWKQYGIGRGCWQAGEERREEERELVGGGERESLLNEANHTAGTCVASGWQAAYTTSLSITVGPSA